VYTTGQDRGGG